MKVEKTELEGVLIVTPDYFGDNRGSFGETYSKRKYENLGIFDDFVQDNHSISKLKGTVRGIHFQNRPQTQSKLVRCVKGSVMDVIVDFRRDSDTYLKWISVILSEENKAQVYIPAGFGHGFKTLVDDCEIEYKVNNYYSPEHDRSIRWNDPDIGVEWGVESPIMSEKDSKAPLLKDSDINL